MVRQGATSRGFSFATGFSRYRPGGAGQPGLHFALPSPGCRNIRRSAPTAPRPGCAQEAQRRARFAAIVSKADLDALQASLRETFLRLLDGFPEKTGAPPVRKTGTIEADDYVIEKLAYESFPGYFVSALLYKPKTVSAPRPGVLSPCGHSTNGKAAVTYQTLHINLAKRGYVVLTYDPVGQGERSQFWDAARGRSRFNLSCGEHAVLGNPLYLLGTSLARYRIWDGIRGLDYLMSRPEVDPARIGCVGNSGGGTLTAYIAALDPRVAVAAIGCYYHHAPAPDGQSNPGGSRPPTPSRTSSASSARGSTTRGCSPCVCPGRRSWARHNSTSFPSRELANHSPRRSASTRSPTPAIASRWPRPPRDTGSRSHSEPPCMSGSIAGSWAGRMSPWTPRSPSSPGPTGSCWSAPTVRSTSRSDRGRCCR